MNTRVWQKKRYSEFLHYHGFFQSITHEQMKTYFLLAFHVLFFWMISMSVTQNFTANTVWNMNALFRFSDVCWQLKWTVMISGVKHRAVIKWKVSTFDWMFVLCMVCFSTFQECLAVMIWQLSESGAMQSWFWSFSTSLEGKVRMTQC